MASIVSITKVARELKGELLFKDVTFSIFERDRLALIGPNGSGKSTLLNIVAGSLEPDAGRVTAVSGTRIQYVPQESDLALDKTLEQTLRDSAGLDASLPLPGEVLRLAGRAGFEDLSVKVSSISGGWKKRLSLVCALSQDAEVYLLDEPTNHLDVEGVWWLEELIASHSAAFVICSHDRYFLQKVTSRTLEVNAIFEGGTFSTDGSYVQFMERRHAYIEAEARRQSKLKNILRRESEWASRQPRARGTKARARLDAAEGLSGELSELKGRLSVKEANLEFGGKGKRSRRLIEVEKLAKSFGDHEVFREASFVVTPGMVLGLLGVNGSGKSTILKLISEELKPDAGRIKIVQELKIGYFDQGRAVLDDTMALKRVFAPDSDAVIYNGNEVHVSSWAQRFGFEYQDIEKPLGSFSGGEKARAYIGYLMLQDADVLLLDEPTNDLDIETLELLERAIAGSDKAFIIVSHDRFFLEEVCTDFFGLTDEKVLMRFGGIEQWEADKRSNLSSKTHENEAAPSSKKGEVSGLNYEEQKEHRSLEGKIEKREGRVEELKALMLSDEVASDPDKLLALTVELEGVQEEVEDFYERWEQLEIKKS
jgi:ATP-binding cassette subfamily F protein uup